MTQSVQSARILLVEDEPVVAAEIRVALEASRGLFDLEWVRQLFKGIWHLGKKGIDAVFLDLSLPDCQGMETFDKLFSAMPDVPILILGANVNEALSRQAVERGARDNLLPRHINSYTQPRGLRNAIDRKVVVDALYVERESAVVTLNSIGDAVLCTDISGNIIYLNLVAERMTGWCREEAIGQPLAEVFRIIDGATRNTARDPMEMAVVEGDQEVVRAGATCTVEEIAKINGTTRLFLTTKSPCRDADQQIIGTMGISRNITERKKTEERMEKTVGELKRSNEELQQFAHVASHDLQEPLRMVASYTQLLARRYKGRLDADADEFISYAVDGCDRMQELIQDLLAYSRAGTSGNALVEISSENALKVALGNLQAAMNESGAVVTYDLLPAITTDDTELVQVFQNLVGNAIKYRGAEVPLVHVSAAKNGGEEWIFSVRHIGLGIAP
jgi:PAS domain S-box-containing protein